MPSNEELLLAQRVIKELEHYGSSAQFVACVQVAPNDGIEYVFVTSGEFHPRRNPSSASVQYVRYRLPLGRLAEATPGQNAKVIVEETVGRDTRTRHVFVDEYFIRSKDIFRVSNEAELIDAVNNEISFADGSLFIRRLREWLGLAAEEMAAMVARPIRRRVANRFELADIPVVDRAQGDIWRLDIRKFIVIAGAPGTGKTTTAIKRIAQKTDAASLAESREVTQFPLEPLRKWLKGPTGWALFTPSELLRGYLHEALAQEGLAVTEDQVPVWSTTKVRIARDVLRYIGQDRFLSLGQELVATRDSKSLTAWTKGFLTHFNSRIHVEVGIAVSEQSELLREVLGQIQRKCAELRLEIEPLRDELEKLRVGNERASSDQERDKLRHQMNDLEAKLNRLTTSYSPLAAILEMWQEVMAIAKATPNTSAGRTLGRFLLLRDRFRGVAGLEPENTMSRTVSAAIRGVVAKFVDESGDALDSSLRRIPIAYQEYRLRSAENITFYRPVAMAAVNDKRVDSLELDSLIYAALITLREALTGREFLQRGGNSLTQRLINEFRYVIAVDEATDFSAVELACMRLLAHPVFDCATFAGDLMQRMTNQGIGDWQAISGLVQQPEMHELKLSYRQSRKLLRIAACLYEKSIGQPAPFSAGYAENADDPDALWYQNQSSQEQSRWVTLRIGEVYRICDQTLPSVAVLVPDEGDVRPVADLLRGPLIETYGIETEACLEGRILGTQAKVRVFSVQFIKGLEFEAVFFLGVDRMAVLSPDLVDRFLYVGLTRARSFLAVTTHGAFPQELSHIRNFFHQGTWEHLLPPPDFTEI